MNQTNRPLRLLVVVAMDNNKYWTEYTADFIDNAAKYTRRLKNCFGFYLPTRKIDWSSQRAKSKGGAYFYQGQYHPGISIAMYPLFEHIGDNHLKEYPHFKKNRKVGEFWTPDPTLHIKAVVCHEIAHAIQTYLDEFPDHGDMFLYYYEALREKFVNPYLTFANYSPNMWNDYRQAA